MNNERNTRDPRYEARLTPSKKFVFHNVIKSIELIMSLPRITLNVGKRIIGLQFLVWIVDFLKLWIGTILISSHQGRCLVPTLI